ncbi:MAG: RHS repeat-associated core domain-containing protein [Fimbriimonadales bacterium]
MERKWFRPAAILVICAMALQACSAGIGAGFSAIASLLVDPHEPFTDSPHPAYLGRSPGRAVRLRGGFFNERTREAADRASDRWQGDGGGLLYAMSGGYAAPLVPPAGGGGAGLPGEGQSGGRQGSLGGVVNTHNGNYLKDLTLFEFPCRGGRLDVDFTLYHNSLGDYNIELGHSWSFTYDARIEIEGSGFGETATIRGGTGSVVAFEDNDGDGTFVRPPGVFDDLIKLPNGTYQVTTHDQVKAVFTKPTGIPSYCLTSLEDRNGNIVMVSISSSGQVTDPTGRQVIIAYIGSKIDTITDPANRVWKFHYDPIFGQDLVKIDYPSLNAQIHSVELGYDTDHNITSYKDLNGKIWSLIYENDKVRTITEPTTDFTRTTEYIYTDTYTDIKNSDATTQRHNYGRNELLTSEVDEAGYSFNYMAYNTNRLPLTIKDQRNKTWTYTYDTDGNALTRKNPYLKIWTSTYTPKNDLDTAKNPYNETWNYDYDSRGNLEKVFDPSPAPKRLVYNHYDANGQMDWTKDAYDNQTTFEYDAHGNLDLVRDPNLKETTADYDVLGRIEWVKDPLLHQSTLHYDEWGRMWKLDHPPVGGVTHSIQYQFDKLDQVTQVTDERGKVSFFTYDEASRPKTHTNAENELETNLYNLRGLLWKVTNGRGYTRTYTYNVRGEPYRLAMPDNQSEGWGYDGNGNTTYHDYQFATVEITNFVYDDANRMTERNGVAGQIHSYGYDDSDRQTSMADASGTTTWEYWPDSQEKRMVSPQGAVRRTYDGAARLHKIIEEGTVPEIETVHAYDIAGRLDTVTKDGQLTDFQYDDASRLFKLVYPNLSYAQYTYDERDRAKLIEHKTVGHALIDKEDNTYDPASNITQRISGGVTTTFGYDNINQLESETNTTGYSAGYTYDENGNRDLMVLGGVTYDYVYDAGDKLTSITWAGGSQSRNFTYDLAGRTKTSTLSGVGTTTYNWNAYDRLTSVVAPGGTETFTYNGADTRVTRTASGTTTSYKRSGAGQTDPVLSEIQGGSTTVRYLSGISEKRAGTSTYYHSGIKNTILQTGTANATKRYDAFGNQLAASGTWNGPFAYGGPFGYQADSNLQLLGDRYYDGSIGRFLTRDSAKEGRNWYSYCANNPIIAADIDGNRVTYVYKLYVWLTGKFLKNGITRRPGPRELEQNRHFGTRTKLKLVAEYHDDIPDGTRYGKQNREALDHERRLNETEPGPHNNERYLGAKGKLLLALLSILTLDPIGAGEAGAGGIEPYIEDARSSFDKKRRGKTGMSDKELEELTGYTG